MSKQFIEKLEFLKEEINNIFKDVKENINNDINKLIDDTIEEVNFENNNKPKLPQDIFKVSFSKNVKRGSETFEVRGIAEYNIKANNNSSVRILKNSFFPRINKDNVDHMYTENSHIIKDYCEVNKYDEKYYIFYKDCDIGMSPSGSAKLLSGSVAESGPDLWCTDNKKSINYLEKKFKK